MFGYIYLSSDTEENDPLYKLKQSAKNFSEVLNFNMLKNTSVYECERVVSTETNNNVVFVNYFR
jgi:hypothetical protein